MKWKFREGGATQSPKDAAIKEFSKHIFESLAREAIQNSLDNPLDENQAVRVKFKFGTISKNNIPGYDNLIRHYKETSSFWQDSYGWIFDNIDSRLDFF